MPGKILIAYASKSNAAAQHAGAIAGALRAAGREVDILNLREARKPSLEGYGAVIIGSGVRMGRWYGPAKRLLKRKELASVKVALFVACATACDKSKRQFAADQYVEPMRSRYGIDFVSGIALPGHMPGVKGEALKTSSSQRWARELADIL